MTFCFISKGLYEVSRIESVLLFWRSSWMTMNIIRPCAICSPRSGTAGREVFHRHFSSLFLRRITGAENEVRNYLCPSCMREHIPYPDQRLRIVVTDSTLHQFFAPPGNTETQSVCRRQPSYWLSLHCRSRH